MNAYPYPHFTREILLADLAFRGGPSPGEPMPDFELMITDGTHLRNGHIVGRQPLLLICSSISCPMTMSAVPGLKRLYAEFGDQIRFVSLYVREAHPGELAPQPSTFEEKLARARIFQTTTAIPWDVAVDTVAGDVHQALDPRSNAAFLMDVDGTIACRVLASNDARSLRQGLQAMVNTNRRPIGEWQPRLVPALRAIGVMDDVLDRAGLVAKQDFRQAVPTGYALICLATLFPFLPPLARGVAALILTLALPIVLGYGVYRLRRPRR